MRGDPERFVTFVLGTFMLFYYAALSFQLWRVGRRIGRAPVAWNGILLERLRIVSVFLWPLPVLLWSHCPECFRGLPRFAALELWPVRLLGLLLLCVAGALTTIAYAELGDRWRLGFDPEQTEGFVRSGIYGSIRHPVYAAFWLGLLGAFLMAPNLLFAILWAAGGSGASAQAELEDRRLAETFGKPYRDYMLDTGKFFPLWY